MLRVTAADGVTTTTYNVVVTRAGPLTYTIEWGDTLTHIARRHGVSLRDLITANGIRNPSLVFAGQVLVIPTGEAPPEAILGDAPPCQPPPEPEPEPEQPEPEPEQPEPEQPEPEHPEPEQSGEPAAGLGSLVVVGVSLEPQFEPARTDYRAGVGHSTTAVTVAACPADPAGSVTISPADADTGRGGHQVALAVGDNTVTVRVTAADGETTTYNVVVSRAGPLTYTIVRGDTLTHIARRHGVTLRDLIAANRISNPSHIFAGQVLTIPTGEPEVLLEDAPPCQPPPEPEPEPEQPEPEPEPEQPEPEPVEPEQSGEPAAGLGSLVVVGVSLEPQFEADRTDYRAAVGHSTTAVTVAACPADPASGSMAITPADADTGRRGHQVPLAVGDNTVTVRVTAADGETTTYNVVVEPGRATDLHHRQGRHAHPHRPPPRRDTPRPRRRQPDQQPIAHLRRPSPHHPHRRARGCTRRCSTLPTPTRTRTTRTRT